MSPALAESHLGLVKSIAAHMATRLPGSVSIHDLVHAGMEGLMESAQRYRPETGVPFPAYASRRIRGSMQDYLRRLDWPSRSIRRKIRRLEQARTLLEQQLGRSPREEELAATLDLLPEEVREALVHADSARLVSLDGMYTGNPEEGDEIPYVPAGKDNAAYRVEREELLAFLCKALEGLPKVEYLILALYYYELLVLREIGEVLQMSEAAVSLRHTSALARLRKALWRIYRLDELRYRL